MRTFLGCSEESVKSVTDVAQMGFYYFVEAIGF